MRERRESFNPCSFVAFRNLFVFHNCVLGNESHFFSALRFHVLRFLVSGSFPSPPRQTSVSFPVLRFVSIFVSVRFLFPAYRCELGNEPVFPAVFGQPAGLLRFLSQLAYLPYGYVHFFG